jgi:hypothetical protein
MAMFDGTDTVVLYDELAYEDVLPFAWRPLPHEPSPEVMASLAERNLRVLQFCAALEEHGPVREKVDETAPHAADLLRIELKVNLLLDLVGQILAASQQRPAALPVRFNARGIVWKATAPLPAAGTHGIAEIYLRDTLAEPLRLPGRIEGVIAQDYVEAHFIPPPEPIADLIEKLAFRRHRRRIAGSRQPRRG